MGLSWSGGKDATMALDKLIKQGCEVSCLMTAVPMNSDRNYWHSVKLSLLEEQAKALSIPLVQISCTEEKYSEAYVQGLGNLKEQYNLDAVAYGDLYIEGHREWGEAVTKAAGLEALYPLWLKKEQAPQALVEFVASGYKAVIIMTYNGKLSTDWLGRELDQSFCEDIQKVYSCPMGEGGEYHTFVYDGPLFQRKIELKLGEIVPMTVTHRVEIIDFHTKCK
ncbi:diphthine--ammonia ligase [Brevibacillus sp. H7]|uniref:Dph6-related ATP pyrophosphatase n=1 Tax=Brevibacillus sp. H7 TaxID=3349138 RepID=UPI00380E0D2E